MISDHSAMLLPPSKCPLLRDPPRQPRMVWYKRRTLGEIMGVRFGRGGVDLAQAVDPALSAILRNQALAPDRGCNRAIVEDRRGVQ